MLVTTVQNHLTIHYFSFKKNINKNLTTLYHEFLIIKQYYLICEEKEKVFNDDRDEDKR